MAASTRPSRCGPAAAALFINCSSPHLLARTSQQPTNQLLPRCPLPAQVSTTFTVLDADTLPQIFAGEKGPAGGCYL